MSLRTRLIYEIVDTLKNCVSLDLQISLGILDGIKLTIAKEINNYGFAAMGGYGWDIYGFLLSIYATYEELPNSNFMYACTVA